MFKVLEYLFRVNYNAVYTNILHSDKLHNVIRINDSIHLLPQQFTGQLKFKNSSVTINFLFQFVHCIQSTRHLSALYLKSSRSIRLSK